jgi:hypothetical protein
MNEEMLNRKLTNPPERYYVHRFTVYRMDREEQADKTAAVRTAGNIRRNR